MCLFTSPCIEDVCLHVYESRCNALRGRVCVCVELRDSETPAGRAHWDREHVLRAQTRQTNGPLQAALTHHLPPPPQPETVGPFPAFTFPM